MSIAAIDRALGSEVDRLVDRAASGDQAAFGRLVDLFVPAALRTATAILGSESDARDAVQEAFVSAWRELPRLRDRRAFEAWLTRIVVNRCRSQLRHRRVVEVREIRLSPEDDAGDAPPPRAATRVDSPVDALAEADAIRRAFRRLAADARTLVVLHHVEGRSISEIANLLGAPEGTLKWRLHAARALLARALEDELR